MPFFYLPSLRNRGGVEGVPAAALPAASGHDGAQEEGGEGEGGPWGRFPAAARAKVEQGGLATTAAGRRRPWAGILEARRRSRRGGEARGDPEGAIPYLGSGWGAAERAGHGGWRRRAELLGAAALEGRGGELEVVDRLWRSEAR